MALNRRRFLTLAASGTVLPSLGPVAGTVESRTLSSHSFVTRPDLQPAVLEIRRRARRTDPGLIFLTPAAAVSLDSAVAPREKVQNGPLIVDDAGQPVWFAPSGETVADLRVQQYRGKPVLSWFQGEIIYPPGYGKGEYAIVDESYRRIATVRAGNGLFGDLHEFVITSRDTALLIAYHDIRRDLSGLGGPADAMVTEGVVQEVDIATGAVLFEWRSTDHIAEWESMVPIPPDANQPYDYIHLNSVVVDGDGLLVSGRNTHTVYHIDRRSGAVNWRLNGKFSDFRMGPESVFAWQHDARRQPDGTISVFDNSDPSSPQSARALVLTVDEAARTAEMVRSCPSPRDKDSASQGNAQLLPSGHVFVGWGALMSYSEFGTEGELLYDARFTDRITSYRSYRSPWVGKPLDLPAVAGRSGRGGGTGVYMSWNGATEVTDWRVLAGPDPAGLRAVGAGPRTGFETRIDIPGRPPYVAAEALDAGGAVLATSEPVRVSVEKKSRRRG